jgi:hypothetical protein
LTHPQPTAGDQLTTTEFCELIAKRFGLTTSSEDETIELHFQRGKLVWARRTSRRIGLDELATFALSDPPRIGGT